MYNYTEELSIAIRKHTYAERKAKRTYTETEYRVYSEGSADCGTYSMKSIYEAYKYTVSEENW